MALQGANEAHIKELDEVAAVGVQGNDNKIVRFGINEEPNANMTTMAIQHQATCSAICIVSMSFVSSMGLLSYTAADCGAQT